MAGIYPSKMSVLKRILQIPISCVVDVGVRECTGELIKCFPEKKHYLFEPASIFYEKIAQNYDRIDYELFPIALSDDNSTIFLILTSLQKNGQVTHSKISIKPIAIDGAEVVECTPVEVRRFDSLALSSSIKNNFLLKVDVDGKDLNVIKGFGESLRYASAVIIECTYITAVERMAYLQSNGFELIDMVDIVYYGQSLYQFDAVFVRKDLINSNLRPQISNFQRELWTPLCFTD